MSDIGSPENGNVKEFVRNVHEIVVGGRRVKNDELDYMISQCNLEKIGMGGECVVVSSPQLDRETKVLAVDYRGMQKPLEAFYLQRIYSTLFPKNFPSFYMASKDGFTLRERVKGSDIGGKSFLVENGKEWEGVLTNFQDVYEFQRQINPPVFIDDTFCNFMLSIDGDIVFVDSLKHKEFYGEEPVWDVAKIKEFMGENKYKDTEITRVLKSIDRLVALGFAKKQGV